MAVSEATKRYHEWHKEEIFNFTYCSNNLTMIKTNNNFTLLCYFYDRHQVIAIEFRLQIHPGLLSLGNHSNGGLSADRLHCRFAAPHSLFTEGLGCGSCLLSFAYLVCACQRSPCQPGALWDTADDMQFHNLPREPYRRVLWLRAIGCDGPDDIGAPCGHVCPDRFIPGDYEMNIQVRQRLDLESRKRLLFHVRQDKSNFKVPVLIVLNDTEHLW